MHGKRLSGERSVHPIVPLVNTETGEIMELHLIRKLIDLPFGWLPMFLAAVLSLLKSRCVWSILDLAMIKRSR